MLLLDTNVISEVMRIRPDPAVSAWLRKHPRNELWTASVVVAELLAGVALLATGSKKRALGEAVEGVIGEDFRGQILRFDLPAARHYAQIRASRQHIGRPIREVDAMIAAITLTNAAVLATRNTRDFEHCGIKVVNPWL
jgi:predicted nucleic acid-binding protein